MCGPNAFRAQVGSRTERARETRTPFVPGIRQAPADGNSTTALSRQFLGSLAAELTARTPARHHQREIVTVTTKIAMARDNPRSDHTSWARTIRETLPRR